MDKKIILTGVSGQAGSYFADYLLKNTNYEIYGMTRRLSVKNHENIEHIKNNPRFHLFSGDLNDSHSINRAIEDIKPDYFINCAAQSFVFESWVTPANTFEVDSVSIIHILESIRKIKPQCRFINFGSSEEMGDVQYSPQDENHPPRARSVYGAAKIAARQIIKVYRESYNLYCIQSWNYNYESKRRGEEFVTRKITKNVARIYHAIKNKQPFEPCKLGNLDSKRDWSHCEDIIDGVWKMMNQEEHNGYLKSDFQDAVFHYRHDGPNEQSNLWESQWLSKHIKEYVLSSNKTYTVKYLIETAFKEANIDGVWTGEGINEQYVLPNYILEDNPNIKSRILVKIDPQFFRPADVELLQGNSDLARKELGWNPKYTFNDLIKEMVESDIKNYIP